MLVAVLMALMVSCAPSAGNETHIVILATSDLHGNVWGYTYEDNAESSNNGMARLYTYIKQVREENPLVFLIDGGDDIQGTIMTDDIANKVPDSEHPVMAAMNFMSYDSMTLGNHEFNWGISTMKKILSQAKFPVLGANILDQDGNYITGVDLPSCNEDASSFLLVELPDLFHQGISNCLHLNATALAGHRAAILFNQYL